MEGAGKRLQQIDAADRGGREELQELVAVGVGHHDLAGGRHARQQRQADVEAGAADLAGVARADGELAAQRLDRLGIGHRADGAGADDGVGHLGDHGLDAFQRGGGAQRHLQHAHATGDQGARQRHGVLDAVEHDHGDHGAVAGEAECVHGFRLSG